MSDVEDDRGAVGGGEVVPFAGPGPDPLEGHVGGVVDRAVGVAGGDVFGEVAVDRFAVGDPVGADDARVADVDRPGVGHVEADPEAHQEQRRDQQPGRRPDRAQPLPPAAEADPQRAPAGRASTGYCERHRDADFAAVEEEVGDAEAEQDQQVEVGDPPPAAPVEEADQEERAERQEDVGGVELVGELARSSRGPSSRRPGTRSRTRSPRRSRVDDDQGELLAVCELADLPVCLRRRWRWRSGQGPVARALLDHLRVAVGRRDRFGFGDLPRLRRLRRAPVARRGARGASSGRADEEQRRARPPPAGITRRPPSGGSRSLERRAEVLEDRRGDVAQRPLLALVGGLGAAADEEQRAEESPACREPWLPPPAWVTPPQSTASKPSSSERTKSPACGAVSADQTRASGSG